MEGGVASSQELHTLNSQLQGRKVSSMRDLRNLFTMERRALQS